MRKHKNFMSEPDYGYIDIESCFEPIFEPPLELWKNGAAGRMNPNRHWRTPRSMSQSRMASNIFTAAIPGFGYPSISPRQANPWIS